MLARRSAPSSGRPPGPRRSASATPWCPRDQPRGLVRLALRRTGRPLGRQRLGPRAHGGPPVRGSPLGVHPHPLRGAAVLPGGPGTRARACRPPHHRTAAGARVGPRCPPHPRSVARCLATRCGRRERCTGRAPGTPGGRPPGWATETSHRSQPPHAHPGPAARRHARLLGPGRLRRHGTPGGHSPEPLRAHRAADTPGRGDGGCCQPGRGRRHRGPGPPGRRDPVRM